jgi:hypothetical protein
VGLTGAVGNPGMPGKLGGTGGTGLQGEPGDTGGSGWIGSTGLYSARGKNNSVPKDIIMIMLGETHYSHSPLEKQNTLT